jgi:hypothetical protein
MPRQMPIEYAGAIFHVLSRGDRRRAISLDVVDCGRTNGERLWMPHYVNYLAAKNCPHASKSVNRD